MWVIGGMRLSVTNFCPKSDFPQFLHVSLHPSDAVLHLSADSHFPTKCWLSTDPPTINKNSRSSFVHKNPAHPAMMSNSTFREAPSPKFGSSGVFDWNEAKKLQFAVFNNISNVYTKVGSIDTNLILTKLNLSGQAKPKGH